MSRLVLILTLFLPCALAADTPESAAARQPLEAYLRAHATGSAAEVDRAFHPQARIQGMRLDGTFADFSVEDYRKGFNGNAAPDEDKRQRRIDFVDVRGNAAVGRVTLDYPSAIFTDYFLLLKKDGQWRIMNKIFQVEKK